MNKFISFSGGVESTTMCILYGKGAKAIWADTGAEHDVMYERLLLIEEKLKKFHKGDFEIIKVKASVKHKGEYYEGLENLAIAYQFMPSSMARYCTGKFKIEPIDEYLSEQGECELMIGFNLDEQGRTGSLQKMPNVNYTYPLINDGYDRKDCEEILNFHGLHPNFPIYMSRGGCRMCFFKSKKEYKAMYFLNPNEFEQVIKFEEEMQEKRTYSKKFFSILGTGQSLRQLAAECEQEKAFLGEAEILKLYQREIKVKTCGAFCGR